AIVHIEAPRRESMRGGNAMTEAEWLVCNDPDLILHALPGPAPPRKLRLYGCACVRGIWHLLSEEPSKRAVEVVERYVDGCASTGELDLARDAAEAIATRALYSAPAPGVRDAVQAAVSVTNVIAWA